MKSPPKRSSKTISCFHDISWTSQIKPLTEEEKQERLSELRQKLDEKRARKKEEELKEQKVNENLRRKAGKAGYPSHTVAHTRVLEKISQDLNKLKEDIKVKQALKEAEDKKRGALVRVFLDDT